MDAKQNIMNTYNRFPIALEHGEGMYVWDDTGKKYLDFAAGIAVNSLGHNHKRLVAAISNQASKAIHVSNLYWTKQQIELAFLLTKYSGFESVFFCNSGAESIECALKLARKYARANGYDRHEIIAMDNSFHGRTFGAITATGQTKYQEGLEPLLPGIIHVPFNDFESLTKSVTDKCCAILIEPIQGEGGMNAADKIYLEKVKELCEKKDILLIFDEVQSGVGRTGELFAYMHYGVKPDILTTAKGLAGGVPIGATFADIKVSKSFKPGDHASTFGGNPLATAAAAVVIKELMENGLIENVRTQSNYLLSKLNELKNKYEIITEIRGKGLMLGMELKTSVSSIINNCIEKGLLLISAGSNVIRFVPPLILAKEDIDYALEILEGQLKL